MQLIDSHCHLDRLDYAQLGGDIDTVLAEAARQDISHMLCVCIDMTNFPDVLSLAHRYDNIYASVGVHPNEETCAEPSAEELVTLAANPRVVAIGETGLDYYRTPEDGEWQRRRFRQHIIAAKASGKPLIVHTRQARADTIGILKEAGAADVGGVMHCFTEDWPMAKAALDLGFYISFSGIVTFKNAGPLREVAKQVPLDRLLVETDAPYLTPVPLRGKPNQPAYVRHVAAHLSALRGEPLDVLASATTHNFFSLFMKAAIA